MGKLYVMRHASSYYIDIGRYAGNLDIPLSSKGVEEALRMGKEYSYNNFDVVFTSTLSRSFDTAILFLSQLNLSKFPIRASYDEMSELDLNEFIPIVQFSELNERDYGILQNMDKKEIENAIPGEILRSWRRDYYSGPQEGESFQQVVSRTARFYYNILLPTLQEKDVLVVAHQNTIRALYFLIFNIKKTDISTVEFDNADIWEIDYESINDMSKVVPNDAVILAAGKGIRMGDLTNKTPKPLLPVHNRPLIDYLLDYLRNRGVNTSVVYSTEKEEWNYYINKRKDVRFFAASRGKSYHDSLLDVISSSHIHSNYIFIISGDMVFDFSVLDKALRNHIINQNEITVVINGKYGKQKKWKYVLTNDHTISDIVMTSTIQPYERYFIIANMELLKEYKEELKKNDYLYIQNAQYGTGASFLIKNLIDLKRTVNYVEYDDFLVNVNYPDDLLLAERCIEEYLYEEGGD